VSGGGLRRQAAALLHGRGGAEEEERGGGAPGAEVKLQKLQGPRCKTIFSHCFISQMRKWSN
jgi:hypothetical protein